MREIDPVPTYTPTPETSNISESLQAVTKDHNVNLPVLSCHITGPNGYNPAWAGEQQIVKAFFTAIGNKQSAIVAAMIESNYVTPATVNHLGNTPLITATELGNVRMVQELVDFGADVDGWGQHLGEERTPLMVAAGSGNLTLVKLFVDVFHANDALIAPDGQMALRLAVQGRFKEIVEFLPTRRGGGWRRWKVQHAIAVRRMRRALLGIYRFFEIALWKIPKFFLWTAPKKVIFDPIKEGTKWCWHHRKGFGPWLKRQIVELPKKAKITAITIFKETWNFVQSLPRRCNELSKVCWNLLIIRLPAALKALAQWLWRGIEAVVHAISSIISRIASFIHTTFTAIMSFFRNLSIKDIWHGFLEILHAIFVHLPAKIWNWAKRFGDVSYQIMKSLGGFAGEVIWFFGWVLVSITVYVPKKLWVIISNLCGSMAKGLKEIGVWIDPKR